MRTIKFRAWLKLSEEMYQVGKLDFEKRKAFIFADNFDLWVSFEDIELMQFTGLYDKNGVEIYEGDISKSKNGTPKEWTFVEGCFCINNDYEYLLFNQRHINQIEFEIIGNIHENPELLEK